MKIFIILITFITGVIQTCVSQGLTPAFKPTQSIDILSGKLSIKSGELFTYSHRMFGSVGIMEEVSVKNNALIKIKEKSVVYKNAPLDPMMTGNDEATVTYLFESLEKGITEIIIQQFFRGELQAEYEIKITIE